jgi:hypothetical protein
MVDGTITGTLDRQDQSFAELMISRNTLAIFLMDRCNLRRQRPIGRPPITPFQVPPAGRLIGWDVAKKFPAVRGCGCAAGYGNPVPNS